MTSEESTTPDPVELMTRYFEAVRSGDLDAELSFYAPDATWEEVELGASFEGTAAIRALWEDWRGRYEQYVLETQEFLDLGNGVGFLKVLTAGQPVGSPSNVRVEESWGYMYVIDNDGVIVRVVSSRDVDGVRAAAERLAEERE